LRFFSKAGLAGQINLKTPFLVTTRFKKPLRRCPSKGWFLPLSKKGLVFMKKKSIFCKLNFKGKN